MEQSISRIHESEGRRGSSIMSTVDRIVGSEAERKVEREMKWETERKVERKIRFYSMRAACRESVTLCAGSV